MNNRRKNVPTDVIHCARCNGGHTQLVFKPLQNEIRQETGADFTHWAKCPNTGEPILMIVVEAEDTDTGETFEAIAYE